MENKFDNRLKGCKYAEDFHERIQKGKNSLWLLSNKGKHFALLIVDLRDKEIHTVYSKNRRTVKLPYELAIEILDKLNVRADRNPTFFQVGALTKFRGSPPEVSPVSMDGKEMWIWRYQSELIIAVDESSDGKLSWSRFTHTSDDRLRPRGAHRNSHREFFYKSQRANHMDLGQLLQVIIQFNQVAARIREPAIDARNRIGKMQPQSVEREAQSFPELAFSISELRNTIFDYNQQNSNDDARICFVLKSIRKAFGDIDHEKDAISSRSRELIRNLGESFDQIHRISKQLDNDLESIKSTKVIDLKNGFQLEEVNSPKRVAKYGEFFRNCLSDPECVKSRYQSRIDDGSISLWVLLERGMPIALFTVDHDKNEIEEFEGKNRHDVDISYQLAMEILIKPDTQANDISEFYRVGAFNRFKTNLPIVSPIVVRDMEMWIWRFEKEFIIAVDENLDGNLRWSRFTHTHHNGFHRRLHHRRHTLLRNWFAQPQNHLMLDELFPLMLEYPEIAQRINGPIIDKTRSD